MPIIEAAKQAAVIGRVREEDAFNTKYLLPATPSHGRAGARQ